MMVQNHVVFHKQTATAWKKAEVHSKTWKNAKVWRLAKKYVERDNNLNASDMCWQMGEDLTNSSWTC